LDLFSVPELQPFRKGNEIKSEQVWQLYSTGGDHGLRRRLEAGVGQAVVLAVDPSTHVEHTLNTRMYDLLDPYDFETGRRMALLRTMEHATPVMDLYLHGLSVGGVGISTSRLGPFRESSPVDPAELLLEEVGSKGRINVENATKKILHLSSSLHDLHNIGFWTQERPQMLGRAVDHGPDILTAAAVLPRRRIFDNDGSFRSVHRVLNALHKDVNEALGAFGYGHLGVETVPVEIATNTSTMDREGSLLLCMCDVAAGFARHWYQQNPARTPREKILAIRERFRTIVYNGQVL